MKDAGKAKEFLDIQIFRNREKRTLHISQSIYARKIIDRFQMANANPASPPMEFGFNKVTVPSEDVSSVPFRELLGS